MKNSLLFLLTSLWLAAVCFGTGVLAVYEYLPGPAATIPAMWPPQSKIPHATNEPTLVMFAHPDCPCTSASMGELTELMTYCQNKVKTYVVFLQPDGSRDDWLHTDLWRSAQAIPGVTVLADKDGAEANHFQATTSGQVILYDTGGKLLFRGGITASRGHYGENAGLSALMKLLHGESAPLRETPVFGCSLLDPKPADNKKAPACTR